MCARDCGGHRSTATGARGSVLPYGAQFNQGRAARSAARLTRCMGCSRALRPASACIGSRVSKAGPTGACGGGGGKDEGRSGPSVEARRRLKPKTTSAPGRRKRGSCNALHARALTGRWMHGTAAWPTEHVEGSQWKLSRGRRPVAQSEGLPPRRLAGPSHQSSSCRLSRRGRDRIPQGGHRGGGEVGCPRQQPRRAPARPVPPGRAGAVLRHRVGDDPHDGCHRIGHWRRGVQPGASGRVNGP